MFYTRNLFFCAMVTLLCACSDSDKSKNLPDTADTPDTTDTNETTFDVSTEVTAPTPEIISRLSLDTDFYKQYIDADGLPIVASTSVSPYALLEARWTIRKMMINRPDLMAAIASTGTRLSIMAADEFTTDIPEHSDLTPAEYWDKRARGLGATSERPAVSTGEENIIQLPGDPYSAESILVHEFAHVVHQQGMNTVDGSFESTLNSIYEQAIAEGLWQNTYAATNSIEYFAEGVQSWFGTNRPKDNAHNEINTREELAAYDIRLTGLIEQVFGDNQWQYKGPMDRADEKDHLKGYDASTAREFSWPERLANVNLSSELLPEFGLPALPNVLAEDWSTIASPSSATSSRINFYNITSDTVSVRWVDLYGQHRDPAEYVLSPSASGTSITFEGHLFEVLASDGITVIARFRADALPGQAIIK